MSRIDELIALLKECGVTPKLGLRQQGHMATVQQMLAMGATWDEIGLAIGWHGPTAKHWYELESNRELSI